MTWLMTLSVEQKKALEQLHARRPDLVAPTGVPVGSEYVVDPAALQAIAPDDGEAIAAVLTLLSTLAPSTEPYSLSSLCEMSLPILERAAALDVALALRIAAELRATEFPSGYVMARDASDTVMRIDAIAAGGCGCSVEPLPYRDPFGAPFLCVTNRRTVSEQDYVTVEAFDVRCERCGASFDVTKRTDYDRFTFAWNIAER